MSTMHPAYAPEFAIAINGRPIPAALRASVTSVHLEDGVPSMLAHTDEEGLEAADRVEIEFANVDLRWLQHHIRGLGFQPFPTDIKIGPARIVGPTGCKRYSNEVTTPKLPPPPRKPQKRSGCSVALVWRNWPSAVTMSAASRLSLTMPWRRDSQPKPPPSVSPAIPVVEIAPPTAANPKACVS